MLRHIAILTLLISISANSFGQQNGDVYRIKGTNNYCAAIKSSAFQLSVAKQLQDNWCWAACTQMVLHYQGIDISQDEIVKRAFGVVIDEPAGCDNIVEGANGWNYKGTAIEAWSVNKQSAHDLIDALAYHYPIIIGLNIPKQDVGHAYVLTAIYFRYKDDDIRNIKIPYSVVLRDPWPPNKDTFTTTWEDFVSRINCIVHVTH